MYTDQAFTHKNQRSDVNSQVIYMDVTCVYASRYLYNTDGGFVPL